MTEEALKETKVNRTCIGLALQTLEAVCCTSSLIAIVYFITKQILL